MRREIRDMRRWFPIQWELFLLALRDMQLADQAEVMSYFQVAGIHGRPYDDWEESFGNGTAFSGYCPHSDILFLPWHRMYTALFEEALYDRVQIIADQYVPSIRERYVAAAQGWRMPYWDWALLPKTGQPAFPSEIFSPTQVTVTNTSGQPEEIPNPLYRYDFHPVPERRQFPDRPVRGWPETMRHPEGPSLKTHSNDTQVIADLLASLHGNRDALYMLFATVTDFASFSNNNFHAGKDNYSSLESIHNNIHNDIGGLGPVPGHMTVSQYAAFDPVFWLHHSNVDRLFAMWQVLNPDAYVTPERSSGTYTIQRGTIVDGNTPLTPFRTPLGEFQTSISVRNVEDLGYIYPETVRWNFPTLGEYQRSVRALILEYYGNEIDSRAAGLAFGEAPNPAAPGRLDFISMIVNIKFQLTCDLNVVRGDLEPPAQDLETQLMILDDVIANGEYVDWRAYVKTPKTCLGGSFNVQLYFDSNSGSQDSSTSTKPVGTFSVFAPINQNALLQATACQNSIEVAGAIPLTSALLKEMAEGNLGGLGASDVVPFLRERLTWHVKVVNGAAVSAAAVPGMVVSVVSDTVRIPESEGGFPKYAGEEEVHPAATEGKPGGLGSRNEN
ncbi:common central domain of tyrosinase-domain-containing protein [Lineolata rhizophorae]|uniref:tyrosinase n=1 Tax=Lineolata rhizophorae TaxID=578093 RepID=A0A6A6P8E7_9PEZI|nr:common central domain of tyrosinase-domain-containing protein [Lineolata rhizophorae]